MCVIVAGLLYTDLALGDVGDVVRPIQDPWTKTGRSRHCRRGRRGRCQDQAVFLKQCLAESDQECVVGVGVE